MPIKNKIVSIVDDELSTTNLFYEALRTISGIDVFRFTDPIEALDHLKMNKHDYAVMISDSKNACNQWDTVIAGSKGLKSLNKNNFINSV